jgi:hypothetical protein
VGKFERFINIETSPDTRNNWRLATEELSERVAALPRMIAYAVAKEAFEALLREIPSDNNYKELRNSLKLVEVGGGKNGKESAFAIHIPVKGRKIKNIDVSKTVISIRAKKGQDAPAADVLLLESSGPWTADTIPFWPEKSEAVIVQRKTTKRETDKLSKAQKKKIPGLLRQFKELGRRIKPYKPGDPGRIGRNAKAIPDLAMQALNLEFGGGGAKSKPVFRKVFRSATKSISGLPDRFTHIMDAMTEPNSKMYKNWPKRIDQISSGQAGKFIGFQKRLGF